MSFRSWLEDTVDRTQQHKVRGPLYGAHNLYDALYMAFSSRVDYGTNIFDREWDLLIVLDACRVDALREVADEYDFLSTVDSITSVGTVTTEWMSSTFSKKYRDSISETAYICSNPQGKVVFDDRDFPPGEYAPFEWTDWDVVFPQDFKLFDRAWEYGFNDELHTIPPRAVTDRAIDVSRNKFVSRMVLHYSQPHTPFLGEDAEVDSYDSYQNQDGVSHDQVKKSYMSNLRYVLDDVELLLENVDAERVVITADHGDSHGELSVYGHPGGFVHPSVIKVPWAETTGVDQGTYDPDTERFDRRTNESTDDMLRDLGYIL